MHIVSAIALLLFGWSIGISVIKTVASLPNRFVRITTNLLLLLTYVFVVATSRNSEIASWFHLAWSLILMVLVFGLLRRQETKIHRWMLLIMVTLICLSLGVMCVAGLEDLISKYQRNFSSRLWIPIVVLSAGPTGLLCGLFAGIWTGMRKDRDTGHAKAVHWSWSCWIRCVCLFCVSILCLAGNDLELRWRRDSLLAKADAIQMQLLALIPEAERAAREPKGLYERLPRDLASMCEEVERVQNAKIDIGTQEIYLLFEQGTEVSRWYTDWILEVNDALEPFDRIVESQSWSALHPLLANDVAIVASLYLARATHDATNGQFAKSIQGIVDATHLLDRAIAPESQLAYRLSGIENERVLAINHALLFAGNRDVDPIEFDALGQLITAKPYSALRPYANIQTELYAVHTCSNGILGEFTREAETSYWGQFELAFHRFVELRAALDRASKQLEFPIPQSIDTSPTVTDPWRNRCQSARTFANIGVQAAMEFLHGKTPPTRKKLMDSLDEAEQSEIGFVAHESGWAIWMLEDPYEERRAAAMSTARLTKFLANKRHFAVGPLLQQLVQLEARAEVTENRMSRFGAMIGAPAKARFYAVPPHVAFDAIAVPDGSSDPKMLQEFSAAAAVSDEFQVLDLEGEWVEIGLCFIDNPNGLEIDALQIIIPTAASYFHNTDVNWHRTKDVQRIAKALTRLTDAEFKTRFDAIETPFDFGFHYSRSILFDRELYSYERTLAAMHRLRDFYAQAAKKGSAVCFVRDIEYTLRTDLDKD